MGGPSAFIGLDRNDVGGVPWLQRALDNRIFGTLSLAEYRL